MGYRRALLGRWSRRDWLAVAVVALAVGFLTGAGVLVDATAARTTSVAAQFESPATATYVDDLDAARANADATAVVLPLARARLGSDASTVGGARTMGNVTTVVGVPNGSAAFAERTGVQLPTPPQAGGTVGARSELAAATPGTVTIAGQDGTERVALETGPSGALSPDWVVTRPETVEQVGTTGALVLTPGTGDVGSGSTSGVPLQGALPFFVAGADQLVTLLLGAAAGAGLVLSVAVFGAARSTVADRRETIRLLRATGATRRRVLSLFGARAGLQTAVGVALGYALGVIAADAAASLAVVAGAPVSLSPGVSWRLVGVLGPVYLSLVALGAVAGLLAARPTTGGPPAPGRADGPSGRSPRTDDCTTAGPSARGRERPGRLARIRTAVRPNLLGWRVVAPTAATLAVFLAVAVVAGGAHGVTAGGTAGDGQVLVEPGAIHPFASDLPASHARALRTRGIQASPELRLLTVLEERPVIARGANWTAFAGLTGASVRRGVPPDGRHDAVVGADLASALDVDTGDRLTLGGSTATAVTRVRVSGVYAAREPLDDQLVVPLATGTHLDGRPPGRVQLLRTGGLPDGGGEVTVVGVDAPRRVVAGTNVTVAVTVQNPTGTAHTRPVAASLGDATNRTSVTLAPGDSERVQLTLPAGDPRRTHVAAGDERRAIAVLPPDAVRFRGVPDRAPTGSDPQVTVVDVDGDPVAGARVVRGDETWTTGPDGHVRIPLPAAGRVTLTARRGTDSSTDGERADRRLATASRTVVVADDAPRRAVANLTVRPHRPAPAARPTAVLTVRNPWREPLDRSLTVDGPGGEHSLAVDLPGGAATTRRIRLPRRPPGTYEVRVSDGRQLDNESYHVVGDGRLTALAAANAGGSASSGLGRLARLVAGNVALLLGTLLGLAALTTVGGTTAAFGGAVAARRRTLGVHRAVGAGPWATLRLVLRDAVPLAAVAALTGAGLAGVALWLAATTGNLHVYGIDLLSATPGWIPVATLLAGLVLGVGGATLATLRVSRASPASLLAGGRVPPPTDSQDD